MRCTALRVHPLHPAHWTRLARTFMASAAAFHSEAASGVRRRGGRSALRFRLAVVNPAEQPNWRSFKAAFADLAAMVMGKE